MESSSSSSFHPNEGRNFGDGLLGSSGGRPPYDPNDPMFNAPGSHFVSGGSLLRSLLQSSGPGRDQFPGNGPEDPQRAWTYVAIAVGALFLGIGVIGTLGLLHTHGLMGLPLWLSSAVGVIPYSLVWILTTGGAALGAAFIVGGIYKLLSSKQSISSKASIGKELGTGKLKDVEESSDLFSKSNAIIGDNDDEGEETPLDSLSKKEKQEVPPHLEGFTPNGLPSGITGNRIAPNAGAYVIYELLKVESPAEASTEDAYVGFLDDEREENKETQAIKVPAPLKEVLIVANNDGMLLYRRCPVEEATAVTLRLEGLGKPEFGRFEVVKGDASKISRVLGYGRQLERAGFWDAKEDPFWKGIISEPVARCRSFVGASDGLREPHNLPPDGKYQVLRVIGAPLMRVIEVNVSVVNKANTRFWRCLCRIDEIAAKITLLENMTNAPSPEEEEEEV